MKHFQTAYRQARKALDSAESSNDPWAVRLASHFAVHNAVVAMRNLKTEGRGKVGKHKREIAMLAKRLGFPEDLILPIEAVEAGYPESVYGPLPAEEDAKMAREAARRVVAFLEREIRRFQSQGRKQ